MATPSVAVMREDAFPRRYARFVLKFRVTLVVLLILASLVLATQIPKLDVRNDPDTLLPESNRYVATNLYAEQKFGMGNLMVFAVKVKDGDIFQPWFINKIQEIHNKLVALPHSRSPNFIDLAAQKIKYMNADENGLVFKRLIPTAGISETNPELAKQQLAFLEEGIRTNPVMAPMLVSMFRADGTRCTYEDYPKKECIAKAAYVIGDYTDDVKTMYLPWVRQVRAIMEEARQDPRVEVLVAGEPYFLAWMLQDLVNHWYLFVMSVAIVVVILWLEFRDWRGAAFPMLGVGATIAMTIGLMGFTQYKLTTMMVLTPMLLLAIGVGHSVQITRRYLNEYAKSGDAHTAGEIAIAHMIVPATLSIVTDMVGFATLATVDISFYKDYAYFGMFGMLTLLLTTTTMIPLLLMKFPPDLARLKMHEGHSWESVVGGWLTKLVVGPGKWLPIGVVAAIILASVHYTQIFRGTSDDLMPGVEKGINYARAAFKGSSQTWKDLVQLNQVMPGVISVSVPIRGKEPIKPECQRRDDKGNLLPAGCHDSETMPQQGIFNDPDVLADIEKMENWMRAQPFIGYTGSYAQYIRLVNMLLATEVGQPTDLKNLRIPDKAYLLSINPDDDRDPKRIVEMYNGLLELMTSSGDMDSFVAKDWNEGVILGFINTMDPRETHQVTMDIQQYVEDHKNDVGFRKVNFGLRCADTSCDTGPKAKDGPDYVRPGVGGFLGATEATREVAITNWLTGPLQTMLAIFVVASFMCRSSVISAILTLTLAITLFAQYGLGGYFTKVENWSGNLAFHLQVTLSIAMGLGVDYGIYMASRLREEMLVTGRNWLAALRNTQNTTGSAVLVSVVVLLGSFIPLVGTDLANTWGLAVYLTEALVIDVFTALMLVPLLVYWTRTKFVFGAMQ